MILILIVSLASVVLGIGAVYVIVKVNRGVTSREIQDLHNQVHEGIGKIDLLTQDVKQLSLGGRKKYDAKL